MTDLTTERLREREPEPTTVYDRFLEKQQIQLKRALRGNIVQRKDDMHIEQGRQGLLRFYLNSQEDPDDPTAQSATASRSRAHSWAITAAAKRPKRMLAMGQPLR